MFKIPIKKYAYRLMIFSVIMAVIGVVFQWTLPQYASVAIPFIIIFFFLLTFFTLYLVLKASNSNKKFIFGYMVSRIIKMITMLLFLILYIVFNEEDKWNFAIAFLTIYFSYSIFEIVALKKINEKSL